MRQIVIDDYTYPGNPDRGIYNFHRYLAFSCDVMTNTDDLSKEMSLYWIKTDLNFIDELISKHADDRYAADSGDEMAAPQINVTRSQNPTQSAGIKDEVCGIDFPTPEAFEKQAPGTWANTSRTATYAKSSQKPMQ